MHCPSIARGPARCCFDGGLGRGGTDRNNDEAVVPIDGLDSLGVGPKEQLPRDAVHFERKVSMVDPAIPLKEVGNDSCWNICSEGPPFAPRASAS